jgi:hypothetical protein
MRKALFMCAAVVAVVVAQSGQASAGFLFFGDSGSSCWQPAATCAAPVNCCESNDRCPLTGLPKLRLPKFNLFGSSNNCCTQPVCCQPAPTCSGGSGPAIEVPSAPPSESAAAPYEEGAVQKAPSPPAEVPAPKPEKDAAPAPEAK